MAEDEAFPVSRAAAVERVAPLLADPPTIATSRSSFLLPLATGLPASPGIASGPIATNPEAALAAADEGQSPILVRAETSPDDVHGMARAAGILTSRGGLASHAAVVARGWGIPAVVGAAGIEVGDGRVVIGDRVLDAGHVITIDGTSGEVFDGTIPGTTEVMPEARTLLAWADELGIRDRPGRGEPTPSAKPAGDDRVAHRPRPTIASGRSRSRASPGSTASPMPSCPRRTRSGRILDQLVVEGLAATVAGAYRLTEAGTTRAGVLLHAEQEAWGLAPAACSARRVPRPRPPGEGRSSPPGSSATRTARSSTTTPTRPTTAASSTVSPRSTRRRWRGWPPSREAPPAWPTTASASAERIEQAEAGDQRFVASPRVDSYHGIWFELHEDLIRLAGRTREDEAAAGRA